MTLAPSFYGLQSLSLTTADLCKPWAKHDVDTSHDVKSGSGIKKSQKKPKGSNDRQDSDSDSN